jgi:hypothetical protein
MSFLSFCVLVLNEGSKTGVSFWAGERVMSYPTARSVESPTLRPANRNVLSIYISRIQALHPPKKK